MFQQCFWTILFPRSFKNPSSAILAMAASINFLIDPKVVPGRAGLLVTLFLVMTGFFSDA